MIILKLESHRFKAWEPPEIRQDFNAWEPSINTIYSFVKNISNWRRGSYFSIQAVIRKYLEYNRRIIKAVLKLFMTFYSLGGFSYQNTVPFWRRRAEAVMIQPALFLLLIKSFLKDLIQVKKLFQIKSSFSLIFNLGHRKYEEPQALPRQQDQKSLLQ